MDLNCKVSLDSTLYLLLRRGARLNHHQAVAGDHWAGVGVLVAAKEGAWLLRPSRAPEKVALVFMFDT